MELYFGEALTKNWGLLLHTLKKFKKFKDKGEYDNILNSRK